MVARGLQAPPLPHRRTPLWDTAKTGRSYNVNRTIPTCRGSARRLPPVQFVSSYIPRHTLAE